MLSHHQTDQLKQRFPKFELSYETIIHKNVPEQYSLTLAIPSGRKSYVWFTFSGDADAAYVMDLDKDRRIVKSTLVPLTYPSKLALGTIVYGVVLNKVFVVEDMYYYKGISLNGLTTGEKLVYIHEFLQVVTPSHLSFALPMLWFNTAREPEKLDESTIPYPVHHIQYRSLRTIVPFLNYVIVRKPIVDKETIRIQPISKIVPDFKKPQYRQPTVFRVSADLQYDIYHLYVHGRHKSPEFYDTAYIANYRASVYMNGLFRTIKENVNLDWIEQSDDETEFQDIREERFVDLKKALFMECIFHPKFKRWMPMRVLSGNCRMVSADKL